MHADWEGIYSFISHCNFNFYYQLTDVEAIWKYLKQILADAVEAYVPKLLIRKHQRPKWFTPVVQCRLNQVHSLRRKYRSHPTESNKHKLANAECDLQELMKEAKCNYESSLVHKFANSHDNKIYKYLSSFTKNCSLPQTMFLGTDSGSSDRCKAQLFNKFFYSVFNNAPDFAEPFPTDSASPNSLNNITFASQDIYEILVSLDSSKAMGTDNISPKLLKHCANLLCDPIQHLFQMSLSTSYLPVEWRTHCVTPIFKSGDRSKVSNYRPISLLCVISKVFEKIIFNASINFLSDIFTPHQFGFLPGRSTLQQLLLFINDLLDSKNNNMVTDVIYLDFRKAFDSVSHTKLLHKLQSYGINGTLLQWYRAYLVSRFQYVRINNITSDLIPVLSGVPQGSILGPLLFALFINDLPSCLCFSKPFIYADDTKCLRSFARSTNLDTHPLQSDLNNLFTWSHTSELYFNDSKFAHIRFWSDQLTAGAVTYCVNRRPISSVDTIKDLGILLSSDLTWENHYNLILGKAYKILGLIRRTFSTNLVPVKKKLYISLIRSQLLYCSQVWRPFLIKHILLLERAQRRATKYILNDYCSSYKSRLLNLKLLPLMYIYELNDVIFFIKSYKSSFKHFNINDYIKFSESNTRSGTSSKMIHHRSSSNISHNSYFCRLPRLWNSLPPIDLTLPIPTIKHKLFIFFMEPFYQILQRELSLHLSLLLPLLSLSMFRYKTTTT